MLMVLTHNIMILLLVEVFYRAVLTPFCGTVPIFVSTKMRLSLFARFKPFWIVLTQKFLQAGNWG